MRLALSEIRGLFLESDLRALPPGIFTRDSGKIYILDTSTTKPLSSVNLKLTWPSAHEQVGGSSFYVGPAFLDGIPYHGSGL
jgi:hypothetical protein